jgi:hypothetical protein
MRVVVAAGRVGPEWVVCGHKVCGPEWVACSREACGPEWVVCGHESGCPDGRVPRAQ